MIERILLPTDGSKQSSAAEQYAIDIAEAVDAEVHVLYVAETEATYILTVDLDDEELEEYREYGRDVVSEVVGELETRGVPGKGVVRTGRVAQEVVEYAESQDIDHIVIGRQGRGSVSQYLGSTAEKVVRMSKAPVTVVRTS